MMENQKVLKKIIDTYFKTPLQKLFGCSATVCFLMLTFPPYHFVNHRNVASDPGYGFIFNMPKKGWYSVATVNTELLLLQFGGVLIITGLIYMLLKSAEK